MKNRKLFMRKRELFVALAAAGLVASVVAGREKPALERVEPAARIDTRIRADALDLSRLERAEDEGAKVDLFANPRFGDAAAPGKKKAGKPSAPPLPFAYLGKVIEGGKVEIWLSRGGELLAVAPGDKIGADYRLEQAEGDSLAFTYLPLGLRQTLDLPSVNR